METTEKKTIAKEVFGAENTAAASQNKEELSRYQNIAEKMFKTQVLSPKEMMIPGIVQFAEGIAGGLNSYAQLFYINILRLDIKWVVYIQSIISVYDAINDPLMGILYDKTRTRWGKARPYLLFTPIPFYACTAIMYSSAVFINNDNYNDPKKIWFLLIILFIQETFSTIHSLPRGNILTLMSPNPSDRIGVGVVTNFTGSMGRQLVYALVLPLMDFKNWGWLNISPAQVFSMLGIIAASIGAISNIALALGTKERIMLQPKPAPIKKSLFFILKNKYMLRNFVAQFLTGWIKNGAYAWDVVTQMQIIGGAFRAMLAWLPKNIMNFVSYSLIPLTLRTFQRDKRKGILFFRLLEFVRSVLTVLIGSKYIDNKNIFSIIFAISWGINGLDDEPSRAISDEVGREINDYTEYMTGERPDGTIGLVSNLILRITTPLSAAMNIYMFRWSGYDKTKDVFSYWSQGDVKIYRRVFFLYELFSDFPSLMTAIPYLFYDIVGKKREKMYLELNERRAKMAAESIERLSDEMTAMIDTLIESDKET